MKEQPGYNHRDGLAPETSAYQTRPHGQLGNDCIGNIPPSYLAVGHSEAGDDLCTVVKEALAEVLPAELRKALPDNFQNEFRKLKASVGDLKQGFADRTSELHIKVDSLENKRSRLDETLTKLETDHWFARTLDRTDYRPEPTKWEPVPGTWGREWRRRSPYTR